MTTTTSPNQPALPGFELEEPGSGPSSAMRRAVAVTITALERDGLIEDRHAAMCQLALELADSVTAGRRSGRASAAAMAAAQRRETLLALPSPAQAQVAEQFAELVAELKAVHS